MSHLAENPIQIVNALNNKLFNKFALQYSIILPTLLNGKYCFDSLEDEIAFVNAYSGFTTAHNFTILNPDTVESMSVILNFNSVSKALECNHFIKIANNMNIQLPSNNNGSHIFVSSLDEAAFKSLFTGWCGALNLYISNFIRQAIA